MTSELWEKTWVLTIKAEACRTCSALYNERTQQAENLDEAHREQVNDWTCHLIKTVTEKKGKAI